MFSKNYKHKILNFVKPLAYISVNHLTSKNLTNFKHLGQKIFYAQKIFAVSRWHEIKVIFRNVSQHMQQER